jgi:signal transduction histidine kinase
MAQHELPRVLAVDDEPNNLVLLERVLRRQYRVMCVNTGQEALDMLVQAPFDLILLDIMMPEMDGLQTLQRVRANPATADIPVILISALAEAQDVARGLELGANDYIIKPIDIDVTRARVQTQIALKQYHDERKQVIAELREAQELKNRLLRIASHDLKGPLMNIRMVASLLKKSADHIPDGDSLLDAVDASLDTMQTVIKDFLDTAAMQTGALDLHITQVALPKLVTAVITEHQANALRKNIHLQSDHIEGVIQADKPRFQQVLGNLVSNAVKYSPPDTTVRIWTERDEQAVWIYVADQGPGIPAEEHGLLFTQFGKLSPRPTGGEASTGLGLWIVRHLITLQNGEVGLISPPEGGSTFWLKMPAAVP